MAAPESSILLRDARAGSKDVLAAILDRYGEKLLTLIRARLGKRLRREIEPHDILQETLLEAFRCFDQFDGSDTRTFMGWLAGIATNKIRYQARYFRQLARDVNLRSRGPRGSILQISESTLRSAGSTSEDRPSGWRRPSTHSRTPIAK